MSSNGKKLMRTRAIAANEPSNPARGTMPSDPSTQRSTRNLEDARSQEHGNAQKPGMTCRSFGIEAAFECRLIGGTDDQKARCRRCWGIEAQRHGRDVGSAGSPGQAKGHRGIDQVADQDADGGARDHPGQNERPGHLESIDQQAGHQDHDADVVEHQPEERVDVAPPGPDVAGASVVGLRPRGIHGARSSRGRRTGFSSVETAGASASRAARSASSPTSKYTAAVEAIATPSPNRSDAMPTTVGATKPPVQPTVFIRPAAVPRSSGRITSKSEAKIFAS